MNHEGDLWRSPKLSGKSQCLTCDTACHSLVSSDAPVTFILTFNPFFPLEAYVFTGMAPVPPTCYSSFQLGKTLVIPTAVSSTEEISQTKLKPVSSLPICLASSFYANLETAFHVLMTFTYSVIHSCGSDIDAGGISHLILSSILRSFHL